MAWEIVGFAKMTPDSETLTSLDFCGDTKLAISRYRPEYLNSIFWDASPPLPVECIVSIEGSAKVKKVYYDMVRNNPLGWARFKLSVWERIYGFTSPLENIRRGIGGADGFMLSQGAVDTKHQSYIRGLFFDTADRLDFLVYRPFCISMLSVFCVFLSFYFFREYFFRLLFVASISNSYYAGFLINAQSMEFRYFAPTFFMDFMIVSVVIFLFSRRMLTGFLR